MFLGRILAGAVASAISVTAPASADTSVAAPVDYTRSASWLCRPGQAGDVCGRSDQDATVIQADGSMTVERFHSDPAAPIDCFYVYPTVSTDPGGNASMNVEPAEITVVNQQFARFASVCRPFAPLYRQVTLTALRAGLKGQRFPSDRALAYNDVKDAWHDYLARDNHGRGVVLIGHSQGSLILAKLVKNEIDGKPVQNRIVSVILAGYLLQVPVGRTVGGEFPTIPLCQSASQIGCAINFASFRADSPPPASSRFGASAGPGLEAACVNPAALTGGSGALHAYLGAGAESVVADGVVPGPWTNPAKPVTTPFVEVPGLLSAACRNDAGHNYLAITIHPSSGQRTNVLTGDVVIGGKVQNDWGLHIIDMNLTMGNLIDTVRQQAQAYLAGRR